MTKNDLFHYENVNCLLYRGLYKISIGTVNI